MAPFYHFMKVFYHMRVTGTKDGNLAVAQKSGMSEQTPFPFLPRTSPMTSFLVLLFLAGTIHLFLHIPILIAVGGALALWIVWKLKYLILGILGLEMLIGD